MANSALEPGTLQFKAGVKLKMEAESVVTNEHDRMPTRASQQKAGDDDKTPMKKERIRRLLEQLMLCLDYLDPSQTREMIDLLAAFYDIFVLDSCELRTTTLVQHVIQTGNEGLIRQPVRRMLFPLQGDVDQMVGEILDQGVIQSSGSPWVSPITLVKKKDGGMAFCVDYCCLNCITKLDEFPLPCIDDTLYLLPGARYFTTLDLASRYWQVAMEEKIALCKTHPNLQAS